MVVVTCETDFVAATEDLKSFAHEVALHVAATKPEFIGREDVPSFAVATEEVFLSEQAASSGKPANVIAQMVKGRMGKFFSAHCLLEQPFVRDDKRTVGDLLNDVRIKVGERVEIESFCWMGLQDVSLVKRGES
jgi:elongation factor Ts